MALTNLTQKYKDRSPEETIKLLQNFFINKGYTTRIENNGQSEAKTWSCSVVLLKNHKEMMRTNGKGTTELFSLASGYAELYERFCNNCMNIRVPAFCKKMIEISKQKYGYYFHPQEKLLTFEDTVKIPAMQKYLHYTAGSNIQFQQLLFTALTNEQSVGEPYISLTNPKETPYYDRRIINRICGSGGMAAGNTVEEALNQGLSEICEHYVTDNFFLKKFDTYYAIDLKSIKNPELQEKINAIETCGSKLYIYDLGYNFEMPVMLSVLINDNQICTNVNFGSFPIFDIAVERIITEIYQGIRVYRDFGAIQAPWKTNDESILLDFQNALTGLSYFDEDIIVNKTQFVSTPSSVFLTDTTKNIDNKTLNEYFIKLFNKFNLSIHYIDHSLIKEMSSIHIFIPEIDYCGIKMQNFNNMNPIIRKERLTTILRQYKFITTLLDQPYTEKDFQETYSRFWAILKDFEYPFFDGHYIGSITFSDWLNIINISLSTSNVVFYLFGNDDEAQIAESNYTIFLHKLKKYATLRRYINSGYSIDEIKKIFLIMFNIELTDIEIKSCTDREYIFRTVYYETVREYYNSPEYEEIVESYIYK